MSADGWMPIATAPKDGTWVLVTGFQYDPDDHFYIGHNVYPARFTELTWIVGTTAVWHEPTLWQPLATAPEGVR